MFLRLAQNFFRSLAIICSAAAVVAIVALFLFLPQINIIGKFALAVLIAVLTLVQVFYLLTTSAVIKVLLDIEKNQSPPAKKLPGPPPPPRAPFPKFLKPKP